MIASAVGPASAVSQCSGAIVFQMPASSLKPGIELRRHRADRAGRDEVGADALRAEVAREVAVDGLQRRLRDAHPVIDRPGDLRVEVQADDRRRVALLEQRQHRDGQRLQRVRARGERDLRALDRRVEEVVAERVAGGEGDRVQDAVQRPQRSRRSAATAAIWSGSLTSISSTSGGGCRAWRRAIGHAHGAAEAGQDDLGAVLLRALGDGVRDRLR